MKFSIQNPITFAFHPFFIISVAIFLSCGGNAEKISFYEHSNRTGEKIIYVVTGTGCTNISPEFNDRISSVHTHKNCIVAWENKDCSGRSERISPGTPYHLHLRGLKFNDMISSFQLCSKPKSRPPPPPPTLPPKPASSVAQRVAVEVHNIYRRRNRSPNLRGDDEIHRTAQQHAEYLAKNNKFRHSGNKYGENLARVGGRNQEEAVRNAVRMWYDEEANYNYNHPGFGEDTKHFTAVVWKSTTHLGIGAAWNPKTKLWVVVANYYPAGNVGGYYRENALKP